MKRTCQANQPHRAASLTRYVCLRIAFGGFLAAIQPLAIAADSAATQAAQPVAPVTLTLDAETQRVTPSVTAQWRRLEVLTAPIARPGGGANAALSFTKQELRFEPLVESQNDLAGLLTRQPLRGKFTPESLEKYMQVVPGVPEERYPGPEFKPVRDAFTPACLNSARNYRDSSKVLFRSFTLPSTVSAAGPTASSSTFDSDCLTPLAAIPIEVRRVIGILLDNEGRAFCTATVLSARTILTSRHCFVRAEDGTAEPTRRELFSELITLQTAELHFTRDAFSVSAPSPSALPLSAFPPNRDYIVLQVKSWDLEHFVTATSNPLKPTDMPRPAWIVGSNPTLADVGRSRTAMDFTRGSKPDACAILEVTATGCIYHSCQTGPATSGAGILTFKPGEPVTLYGVHKGPSASAAGCEANPPLEAKLNLAAAITATDLGEN